jgi:serine protease AprX
MFENQPDTDTTGGHGTGTSSSAAGTGDGSNHIYMGVAPQANIIGLSAGDAIAIFFPISSFDYILTHKDLYNIRVNSNSWGPSSSCESCFSPYDPVNVATKAMHDAGITVLFSAGNSGNTDGSISGYAVQPGS